MSDIGALLFLIGRILFPLGVLIAGTTFHIAKSPMAEGYAKQMRFPIPAIAGWPTGIWMIVGSLSVIFGVWGDVGALMIAAFVIPAAAWFHRFWELDDPQQKQTQNIFFFRNVALLGGSLILFAVFTTVGHDLSFTLTDPLFDLSL
jgi:uncharacterized membrane protein YphA (DoxX/SURF4 family)